MTLNLPTPGGDEGTWGQELNDAITALDADLQAHKATAPPVTPASPGRYVPVIIFNGESNSGGLAENSLATPAELAPRPCIQIFDNAGLASFQDLDIGTNNMIGHDQFDPVEQSQRHGWELGLANSVEAGEWWDDTVYLIKTGQGGSKIADWDEGDPYWQTFLSRVHPALSLLRSQGKIPVVYLWYTIGINDHGVNTSVATFQSGVKGILTRIRNEVGYVPVFMPAFMPEANMQDYNDVLPTMAAADNMLQVIDSVGATTIPPGNMGERFHWNYGGMKTLAARLGVASRNFGQQDGYNSRRIDMLTTSAILTPPVVLPSIVRSPTSVSFAEGSAGASFTVVLSAVPASSVTVTVSASGGNVTPDKSSLTFTTSNWSAAQSVTLTSPNDGTQSGNRSSTVTLSSLGVAAASTVTATVTDAFVAVGPANTVLPAITGSTALAGTLTCTTGTWTGSPTGYAYQWKRDGANIAGATANTRVIAAADQGHLLSCAVTATNVAGSNTATSAATSVPAAPTAPSNTVLPVVTGSAAVGSTLTCSQGTWTQSPTGYTYQWKRSGVDIGGETANTHVVVAADVGATLTCTVSATNAQGTTPAVGAGVVVSVPLTPVTWVSFQNGSSPSAGVVKIDFLPGGALASDTIDLTQPFELEVEYATDAATTGLIVYIDDDTTADYVFPGTMDCVVGWYTYAQDLYKLYGSESGEITATGISFAGAFPCKVKIKNVGDDVNFYFAPNGGSYGGVAHTFVGALAGRTTGYIKALSAAGDGQSKQVKVNRG